MTTSAVSDAAGLPRPAAPATHAVPVSEETAAATLAAASAALGSVIAPPARPDPRDIAVGLFSVLAWAAVALVVWLVPAVYDGVPSGAYLAILALAVVIPAVWWVAGLRSARAAAALRVRTPWSIAIAAWLVVWEVTTAKTGWLELPHFAAPQVLLDAFWNDRLLLWQSFWGSTVLLALGFTIGAVAGFFTGLAMGWNKIAHYWIHPVLATIGPVPAGALLPLVFVILPTIYSGSVFMVAFGVWFPVAVLTRAGIAAVGRDLFDVAQTLGATQRFLIWRVAVPGALPSIFNGLFMGLGVSLGALALAELLGVKNGLGWYIQWTKGWAAYPKMYVAIVVMIFFCRVLMALLFRVRNRVLAWEKDLVRW